MKPTNTTAQAPLMALPACLSIEDAATQLGIGRTKVYDLIKAKELASIKIGRRRLIPTTAINAFVEQRYGTCTMVG
jgi:excisionase family DNA binding protein